MSSTLTDFLTSVIPSVGGYVIAHQGLSDVKIRQKYYNHLNSIISFAEI